MTCRGPRPARSGAPRSGRTSRSASSTSSPGTARRWCSPTRGVSPSGSPPGSTRSGATSGATGETALPRDTDAPAYRSRTPAEIMAQSGSSKGPPPSWPGPTTGRSAKEQRQLIEEDLKAGRLPAVVATSSLELGIDMGAVDLVVQVESPPSVASGLQRVGRAGHQVGAVSRGVLFPKFRGDLVQTAVVVERMRAGAIESLRVPANPVDVLAQQIVAMCAMDDWAVDDLERWSGGPPRSPPCPTRILRGGPRHARRALPQRRVRRAPPAHRLGPPDRRAHRPPRRPAPGGDQRRHDPRPRPVCRVPRHR